MSFHGAVFSQASTPRLALFLPGQTKKDFYDCELLLGMTFREPEKPLIFKAVSIPSESYVKSR